MGYGYSETFLVVFLTHPGVIFAEVPDALRPPIVGGLLQAFYAWVLSLPGERSAGFGWTMYTIYLIFLFVYMYLFLGDRIRKGV